MATELWRRPARELVALLREGAVSAREVVDDHLERIQAVDPSVNAVVTVVAERARAEAAAVDAIQARGRELPPLAGLPMTVKDSFETAEVRTTSGSRRYADHVPAADATAVARLRAAGVILVGKTNLSEFAGDVQSSNELFGTTNNPWNLERTAGGSSGGAAAAVATGMTPVELGSDIGGSIRTPAHFCGVCGHKPTHGIVPLRGHIPPGPGQLTTQDIGVAGPLARTADDLGLVLDTVLGPEDDDAVGWSIELPPAVGVRPDQFRVALWLDDPSCPTERAQLAVLEDLARGLEQAGVRIVDWTPPVALPRNERLFTWLLQGALAAGWPDAVFSRMLAVADRAPTDDTTPTERVAMAITQRHADWLRAHEERLAVRQGWQQAFRDVDVVLTPANPFLALPHLHEGGFHDREVVIDGTPRLYRDQLVWAGLAGAPGLPATVVPVGTALSGKSRLPVGVQILGARFADRTTLAFGQLVETVRGGAEWPPEPLS